MSRCHGVTVQRCHGVKVSRCHGVTVSRCQGVNVSRCKGVTVSRCHGVTVSRCQGVKVSRCQGVKVSRCQGVNVASDFQIAPKDTGLQKVYYLGWACVRQRRERTPVGCERHNESGLGRLVGAVLKSCTLDGM